jgi:hypothetical protein
MAEVQCRAECLAPHLAHHPFVRLVAGDRNGCEQRGVAGVAQAKRATGSGEADSNPREGAL